MHTHIYTACTYIYNIHADLVQSMSVLGYICNPPIPCKPVEPNQPLLSSASLCAALFRSIRCIHCIRGSGLTSVRLQEQLQLQVSLQGKHHVFQKKLTRAFDPKKTVRVSSGVGDSFYVAVLERQHVVGVDDVLLVDNTQVDWVYRHNTTVKRSALCSAAAAAAFAAAASTAFATAAVRPVTSTANAALFIGRAYVLTVEIPILRTALCGRRIT